MARSAEPSGRKWAPELTATEGRYVTDDSAEGVSVVVPCRNAAPYLSELLDSLAAQTFMPLEVIVVDDGSTDGSAGAVSQWAAQHHGFPLQLLVQPAEGVASALRRGWATSRGGYLARADADDRVEPGWLHQLVAALDANPDASYSYPAMRRFGDVEGRYPTARQFSAPALVWQGNFVCCGTVMRRDDYLATEGVADLPAWEDWDLWLAFLELGKTGVFVDEELYLWRRHGETRNRLSRIRRRRLRLAIWRRHPRLLLRYAADAPRQLLSRSRRPVRDQ